MKIYRSIKSITKEIEKIKKKNKIIGFVPTMGYLHEGHLMLIKKARNECDCVVVSIYVNPIQFGPNEDFKRYPRNIKHDYNLCRKHSVDIVFVPEDKIMYPEAFSTYVNVEGLTETLCGASRPGHFKGVTTIVIKLFNIVKPDISYFGQKDAQQAIVIKRMVRDLNIPVRIRVLPIVREPDGLAMSSRNSYLNLEERREATSLYNSLMLAKDLHKRGERDPEKIIKEMHNLIQRQKHAKIDYISIVDLETLKDVKKMEGRVLVAIAVWIGRTRLIDNMILGHRRKLPD